MQAELEYVSVGCSRTPHAADWSSSGLLAYAAHESIALTREAEEGRRPARVFATLHGHRGRVNCVQWLPQTSASPLELVSGGVDGHVVVWRRGRDAHFAAVQELTSHSASVTCVATLHLLPSNKTEGETPAIKTLIASGASDSSLRVWERIGPNEKFCEVQSISCGQGFVLCLDLCLLPSHAEPLLVSGADNARVDIYFWRGGKFSRGVSLSGHMDWVRHVETVRERDDLLLASCAQDTTIRLWRITHQQQQCKQHECKQQQEGVVDEELKLKGNVFLLESGTSVSVTLESVLIGHEDWVYSVCWWPRDSCRGADQSDCRTADHLQLLSSSIDKTIILWRPDPSSGVWLEEVRVGEVGGNTLGFYGAQISPRGDLIFAHDYQGGLHLWGREGGVASGRNLDVWSSLPTVGGHFAGVQGLSWEPQKGAFLLSVSLDQTARLHAPWVRTGQDTLWCEIARPQIHGYDMTCVAMTTSFQYTSGADEKVMRVFEAPSNFVANLSRICQENFENGGASLPLGASVPSLGLSNKAVFTGGGETEHVTKNPFADYVPSFQPVDLTEPPVEAHLLQNTLWPESQKLYGHGYEVYCIAASADSCYIASACKATKMEHAVIRVWEVSSWKQLEPLRHHTLTVACLTFSHNSQLLLATSRDRTWSLWKRVTSANNAPFQLCASLNKASKLHSRVIWTAAWTHDNSCFATGSRDKKVLLWQQGRCENGDCGDGWGVRHPALEFDQPVTALNFAPYVKRLLLAVGLESGHIHLYYCSLDPLEWNLALSLDTSLTHTTTVKELSWKPQASEAGKFESHGILASCSHDNCVKLFRIKI